MNTGRDNQLWIQFWRDQRVDFHQPAVNDLLTRFWSDFDPVPGSRIFVPLCGKSLDILWLARQGHQVVGVELSPVAVQAFFSENRLKASRRRVGKFVHWQHRNISILCGDFFALTQHDLGTIDQVYDRAALTALPEDLRGLYVEKLHSLISRHIGVFLVTTEDAGASTASGIDDEITRLFSANFEIHLAHAEAGLEQERTECKVYRLAPHPNGSV
jgi:thiopurine S-methyltransferase